MKFIIWHQKLGKPECPYLERWILNFKLFSIRLHKWNYGDDPRNFHDHPWNFYGVVLKGSYVDVSPAGREFMPTGKFFKRNALHKHTVDTRGCWTLILTGPVLRNWGFYAWNKSKTRVVWLKAKRYFNKYGHHPCE